MIILIFLLVAFQWCRASTPTSQNYHRMPQQSASTYIHDDYFILSPNFKSKPSSHRRSILAISHDFNSDQDSQSVCSLRTTQSKYMVDTNASNPAEDLTMMGHTFWPIFPPIFYNETTHLKMDPIQRLPFAQYLPSHFVPEEWDKIWNQPGIDPSWPISYTHNVLWGYFPYHLPSWTRIYGICLPCQFWCWLGED